MQRDGTTTSRHYAYTDVKVSLSVLEDIPDSVLGGSDDLSKSIFSVLRHGCILNSDHDESFGFVLAQNNAVLHPRAALVASIP